MKQVLWISRHQMTPEQLTDLEAVLKDEITLLPWPDTVQQVDELLPLVAQSDAVAAVLPIQLLAQLWPHCGERPLLQAVSQRMPTGTMHTLPDGSKEPEYQFIHGGWQQICRVELETQILSQYAAEL